MNVADEEGLEVMDFLKLLAAYELASSFNAMEVQHLLDVLEQRRRATGLHQDLGNAEKSPVPEGIAVQDGRIFQLNSNEHLNGHYLTGNQVLDALKMSSDPAKLVLDTIQFSLKEGNGEIVFGSNVCLLSRLMRVFPKISPHVKEVAMKLAGELKANVGANGENSLGVLALLQLTAIYGLSTLFNEDEILKLLETAAQHEPALELFHSLGLADNVSDFVQKLIHQKKVVVAVRFICAFKLVPNFSPVPLLVEHVSNLEVVFRDKFRRAKSLEAKDIDQEISGLTDVIKCMSDYNLEAEVLSKNIEKFILELESLMAPRINTAPYPGSTNASVPQNHQSEQHAYNKRRRTMASSVRPVFPAFTPINQHHMNSNYQYQTSSVTSGVPGYCQPLYNNVRPPAYIGAGQFAGAGNNSPGPDPKDLQYL